MNFFRDPRTPERDQQSEREHECLNRLQMTSPSIRRQREYDRQGPMPQPNFGMPINTGNMISMVAAPSALIKQRVNWNERLEQNFQSAYAQQLQNRGGQCREQNEVMPMMAGPSVSQRERVSWHQGQNEGVAGPSVPQEERVNWQERVEQGFQANYAQHLQNCGGSLWEQNREAFMRQQLAYGRLQLNHYCEALEHQAHVVELQRQQEQH